MRVGSRQAERVKVSGSAVLRSQRGDCPVSLHDLSVAGARIEVPFARFELWDPVRLRLPFLPDERAGEVAWSQENMAGLRFSAQVDLPTFRFLVHAIKADAGEAAESAPAEHRPEPCASKRAAERAEVAISAYLRTDCGERCFVAMIDLTERGCCLFGRNLDLREGQGVILKPDGLGPIRGTVKWSHKSLSGILFENPLYEAVFRHLAQTHPWDMPMAAKAAIESKSDVPETVHRTLVRLIEQAEAAHRQLHTVRDVMSTRPLLSGSRPGLAQQSGNLALKSRLFR